MKELINYIWEMPMLYLLAIVFVVGGFLMVPVWWIWFSLLEDSKERFNKKDKCFNSTRRRVDKRLNL